MLATMAMSRRGAARRTTTSRMDISVDGAAVAVTVVRSSRRRRTIAVSVAAGSVRVLAPMPTTDAYLTGLLRDRATWLAARLRRAEQQAQATPLSPGSCVPYLGESVVLTVELGRVRRPRVEHRGSDIRIVLPLTIPESGHAEAARTALIAWYRERATRVLATLVQQWSEHSGLVPTRVVVRDQRRRWGSCGPDGTIRLNWRLVLLEPALADYVVVHELAHLRHRHHQAAFWEEVARLIPDHKSRRKRLNESMAATHQFDGPPA